MKVKLLKKLRRIGRDEVDILSITKTNGIVIGMRYSYNSNEYSGIFSYGDTSQQVIEKACRIYLKTNIDWIRKKYAKYSRKNRLTT